MVSEVIGGLGELSGRTLERLTGMRLSDDGATSLMLRAARAWKTPIEVLTCEQLRLLLSQDLGTAWIGPLACMVAARFPNATVSFYPGDLAHTILRKFPAVFEGDPEGARAVLDADFDWIGALEEADVVFDTKEAAEAHEMLKSAQALASAAVRTSGTP
jgi:hypothetical protein